MPAMTLPKALAVAIEHCATFDRDLLSLEYENKEAASVLLLWKPFIEAALSAGEIMDKLENPVAFLSAMDDLQATYHEAIREAPSEPKGDA